jgi:hypothetical protein
MRCGEVELPLEEVIAGERIRASAGDLTSLAHSIELLGLLHPLVLNSRKELVAGFRRLEAVKKLGWKTVTCRVVETLDDAVGALRAERDENVCRMELTYQEIVNVGRRIEEFEKPKAKQRQKAGGGGTGSGKLPAPSPPVRDKVASALGVSGRTYEKAKQVVEAAEAEPAKFGDLPAKLDEQSVDAAHREMRRRREPTPEPMPCTTSSARSPTPSARCSRASPPPMPAETPPVASPREEWGGFLTKLAEISAFMKTINPKEIPEDSQSWQLAQSLEAAARAMLAAAAKLRRSPR